ncbi:MAG: NAD(+)/NADH kinase [Oscillospiraceae bacterium]|nr:NAD(+)/NADH kinase [Oscillospiraceae bacterium]
MNKKIILCPNAGRDIGLEVTRKVDDLLKALHRQTVICPVFDDDSDDIPQGFAPARFEDELNSAELIITFGGDGTILRAARLAAHSGVPILGVNLGGKGFMSELEVADIGLIASAVSGDYKLERRMMLDIDLLRDGETVCSDFALNDVVVSGVIKVIDLTLYGDGQKISQFSGDGAVIATPTGSTAYSMAAGGPIVEPTAHNIIITPICAHVLEAKPFVLDPDRRVSVEIGHKKPSPAYLSTDGCEPVSIQSGDIINVRKSEKYTYFARLSSRSFYTMVSEKLGVGEKP